jgi:DNA-binding NarL/FixJ family response regulator
MEKPDVAVISVVLADDHPMILRGLRDLFGRHGIRVLGEATQVSDVVPTVTRLAPDVLVIDFAMHGTTSLDAIKDVAGAAPSTAVIVLSMHAEIEHVWEALERGARGYVLKTADSNDVVHGVREVFTGRSYLSPALDRAELDRYGRERGDARLGQEALTKRELEVLKLVALGHTSGEIAAQLSIGKRTVESHRASLLAKLGLRNQAALVRYALEKGIVAPSASPF